MRSLGEFAGNYDRWALKRHEISAHPYVFDAFFRGLRWCGSGHVTVLDIAGGVHQAQAIVEADDEGYVALEAAGFAVEELVPKSCEAAASWK